MSELVPPAAGALLALLLAAGTLRTFTDNGWTRENFRGRALPFPGGVVAVAAALLATGALAAVDEVAGTSLLSGGAGVVTGCEGDDRHCRSRDVLAATGQWVVPLLAGVAFLGVVDDLLHAAPRGIRGHAGAVLRGSFSTGALKAAGTLALALLVLSGVGFSTAEYGLAVAVVVLATNAFNLLDLRPGRAAKGLLAVVCVLLLVARDVDPLRPLGAFAGALLAVGLAFDLRERTMLGDTGANVMGAVAGLWIVMSLGVGGQLVALVLLVALTAYGELRSISAAIERITPLRAADRLGRPR